MCNDLIISFIVIMAIIIWFIGLNLNRRNQTRKIKENEIYVRKGSFDKVIVTVVKNDMVMFRSYTKSKKGECLYKLQTKMFLEMYWRLINE